MQILYSGTDARLYVNVVEMLYQMHVPYNSSRTVIEADGPKETLYEIRVDADHIDSALEILADMTARTSRTG